MMGRKRHSKIRGGAWWAYHAHLARHPKFHALTLAAREVYRELSLTANIINRQFPGPGSRVREAYSEILRNTGLRSPATVSAAFRQLEAHHFLRRIENGAGRTTLGEGFSEPAEYEFQDWEKDFLDSKSEADSLQKVKRAC